MTNASFGVDSGVAKATPCTGSNARGLKPTAKVTHRYRGEDLLVKLARLSTRNQEEPLSSHE